MSKKIQGSVFVQIGVGASLLLALSGCSGSDTGSPGSSGGNSSTGIGGSGGIAGTPTGGAPGVGGNAGGGALGTGGSGITATGGAVNTGGTFATGGGSVIDLSTGGAVATGGGASTGGSNSTGGSVSVGGSTSTGGSKTAGGTASTGGTKASGGTVSTGGSKAGGGTTGTGGSKAAGGAVGTGGSTGTSTTCAGADAAEITRVSGWLTNTSSGLPNYAYTNITKYFSTTAQFDKLVCAIVMSCTDFSPSEANWQLYCEAVITSAIVSESSYNPNSVVPDTYSTRTVSGTTANDPTVGLLQDRFSSTVHDFNYNGPIAKMAAIGCAWPAALQSQADTATFWATAGGTTYLSLMEDPACNIALATWYYFINATGNGGSTATYTAQYCAGNGIAGTRVIGLLSHLQGPGFARPPDASNSYVTGIKARFTSLLGGLPNPDPFAQTLTPVPTKFCK